MKNFRVIMFTIGLLSPTCYGMKNNDTKKGAYLLTSLGSGSVGIGYGIQSINKLMYSSRLRKDWGWFPGEKFTCKGACGNTCRNPNGCMIGTGARLFNQGIASGIKSSIALTIALYAWKHYKKLKQE
ncbi:MAG TPA: hypothetical protein VKU36_01020 [Candidatus Babeliales bacterium]|nr:hypothetical protein [Candidatus Babeliales bacterium]